MSTPSVTQKPTTPPPPPFYDVQTMLGKGAFSRVYRVIERNSGSSYALKRYNHAPACRLEGDREIRNLKRLTEAPHVVRGHDYFKATPSKDPMIVEELVEGRDLSYHYLHFTLRDIITTAKQVLEALAYFHERDLIYCDLKPENTLYNKGQGVKLADFGSMRHLSDEPIECIVTAFNRAFEACLGGRNDTSLDKFNYDTSLDMFSFGTFVFRLIAKKGPFEIPGYDDYDLYYHCFMVQLLCEQCGYPSKEQLAPLRFTNKFFTFMKDGKPQLKYPIPMEFTPWKTRLERGCRERGFGNLMSRRFTNLIGRCLQNQGQDRITAQEALKHPLFAYQMRFSVVSNLLCSLPLTLTFYKKDMQKTQLLQVKLADVAALRCLHLSGYSFVKCRLVIHHGFNTFYDKEITIEPHSNLSITQDKEKYIQVTILKGAGQQLPVHTTVSIRESKKRDVV